MVNLENILQDFVKDDSSNKLMITGNWGVGKTYHLNEFIEKNNEKPNEKRFIYVSLFGSKHLNDVRQMLFTTLLFPKKRNGVKRFWCISEEKSNYLIKKISPLFSFFNSFLSSESDNYSFLKKVTPYLNILNKVVSHASIETLDLFNKELFKNKILCFDDIERKGGDLKLTEFIGFINVLSEKDGVKIILLANSDKIEDAQKNELFEKLDCQIVEFVPELEQTYDSVLKVKYGERDETFFKFLAKEKPQIINYFQPHSDNIRKLIFSLDNYQKIFAAITQGIGSEHILHEYLNEILISTLRYTISFSMQYRTERFSLKDEKLFLESTGDFSDLAASAEKQKLHPQKDVKNKDISKHQSFKEKFYPNENLPYYKSIFRFIANRYLEKDLLLQEIEKHYNVNDNNISKQHELINKFRNDVLYKQSDEEYLRNLQKMLDYAEKGQYELDDYLFVCYHIIKTENSLSSDLVALENKLIQGMNQGIHQFKYIDDWQSFDYKLDYLQAQCPACYSLLFKIRDRALEINRLIKENNQQNELESFVELFFNDIQQFLAKGNKKLNRRTLSPIFKNMNVNRYCNFFEDSSNEVKKSIVDFWVRKHEFYPYLDFKPELEFIKETVSRLKNKLSLLSADLPLTKDLFKQHISILDILTRDLEKSAIQAEDLE